MWRHCKHASPSQIGLNIYPNSILNYKKNDHWVSLCKNKKWLRIWNLRTCRLSKLPHYEVKVVILWHSSSSSQLPSCALHCHSLAQASLLSVSRYSGGKIFFSSVLFQDVLGKADFSVVCFDLVPLYFFSFSHSYRLVLSVWSFVFILILLFGGERASHLPSVSVSWLFPWAVYWGILLLLSSWDFTTLSSANSSEHVILPLNIAFGTKNSPEI